MLVPYAYSLARQWDGKSVASSKFSLAFSQTLVSKLCSLKNSLTIVFTRSCKCLFLVLFSLSLATISSSSFGNAPASRVTAESTMFSKPDSRVSSNGAFYQNSHTASNVGIFLTHTMSSNFLKIIEASLLLSQ